MALVTFTLTGQQKVQGSPWSEFVYDIAGHLVSECGMSWKDAVESGKCAWNLVKDDAAKRMTRDALPMDALEQPGDDPIEVSSETSEPPLAADMDGLRE